MLPELKYISTDALREIFANKQSMSSAVFKKWLKDNYRSTFVIKLLPHFVGVLAKTLKPLKDESGKYSASLTLAQNDRARAETIVLSIISRSMFSDSKYLEDRFKALTPLGLYSYKEEYNIKYEEWNKEDPELKYLMGTFLEPLIDFKITKEELDNLVQENFGSFEEARELMLTVKSTGVVVPKTTFKNNINIPSVPKVINFLYFQTWLANVDKRLPNVMILDPWDWDNVPEPVDEIQQKNYIPF